MPTYQFLVSFILGTFSNKSQISKGVKKYQISRVRVTVRISNGLVRVGSSSSKMIQVWVEFCKYIVLTKYQYIQRQISCDNWHKWVQVGSQKKNFFLSKKKIIYQPCCHDIFKSVRIYIVPNVPMVWPCFGILTGNVPRTLQCFFIIDFQLTRTFSRYQKSWSLNNSFESANLNS